jgi:NAD dependent epimerase/dehydratase family enzyme
MYIEAIRNPSWQGVYNATAPNPVRMGEMCSALGQVRAAWAAKYIGACKIERAKSAGEMRSALGQVGEGIVGCGGGYSGL